MADDLRTDLSKQISELRKEMDRISKSMSAHVSDAVGQAGDLRDEASRQAAGVIHRVRDQAHVVSDVARENPATAITVATSIGMLGLAAGVAIGALFVRGLNSR